MKARVKHNNEIIDVIQVGTRTHLFDLNNVEFIDAPEDYWTRLEHQAAIAVMQGLCVNSEWNDCTWEVMAEDAIDAAHALVEKLKEKEERK